MALMGFCLVVSGIQYTSLCNPDANLTNQAHLACATSHFRLHLHTMWIFEELNPTRHAHDCHSKLLKSSKTCSHHVSHSLHPKPIDGNPKNPLVKCCHGGNTNPEFTPQCYVTVTYHIVGRHTIVVTMKTTSRVCQHVQHFLQNPPDCTTLTAP